MTEQIKKSVELVREAALIALWIIGNGFDLNVGLCTGYQDFLNDVYLKDGPHSVRRDLLVKLVDEDPRLKGGKYWSDLEGLLAFATSMCPERVSERDFTGIFEEMQKLFVKKVAAEQSRLMLPLPAEAISEFRDSIIRVSSRMCPRDRRKLPCNLSVRESITWEFIALNYTTVFDAFLRSAIKEKGAEFNRNTSGRIFVDTLRNDILHPHGIISDDSDGTEIIFGTSSPDQFGAENPSEFELLNELWVKPNKNQVIYGNEKTERLSERISNARVFLLYGVSLGDSDRYIWEMIGERMAEATAWTVLFCHGLPRSSSQDSLLYLDKRRRLQNRFLDAIGIDDKNRDNVRDRIIVVPSDEYFMFKDMQLVNEASDVS